MTSPVKVKTNKQQCLRDADFVKNVLQEDLELVNGLSLDQVLRKKWYPSENSPARRMGPYCGRYAT